MTKKCRVCGKRLDVKKFYRALGNADWLTNDCRNCRKESRRASYYAKTAGKLDVVKEVKAPKIDIDAEEFVKKAIKLWKQVEHRFNNFNRVRIQRNISIIMNLIAIGAMLYLILK